MKFLRDKDSDHIPFSKIVVFFSAVLTIVGLFGVAVATIFLALDSTVACTIIGSCGGIGITTIVWYLKKAQAENTIKLYLSSYEELIKIAPERAEDILERLKEKMTEKIDETFDTSISEATSPIERQDIY